MAINIKEFLEDVNTKRSAAVEAAKKAGVTAKANQKALPKTHAAK